MTAAPALVTELIDDVLVVTIDRPDQPVNTLGVELVAEFENAFRRVDEDTLIRAMILISGKRDGFIAGADIDQFLEIRSSTDAERLSRSASAADRSSTNCSMSAPAMKPSGLPEINTSA